MRSTGISATVCSLEQLRGRFTLHLFTRRKVHSSLFTIIFLLSGGCHAQVAALPEGGLDYYGEAYVGGSVNAYGVELGYYSNSTLSFGTMFSTHDSCGRLNKLTVPVSLTYNLDRSMIGMSLGVGYYDKRLGLGGFLKVGTFQGVSLGAIIKLI